MAEFWITWEGDNRYELAFQDGYTELLSRGDLIALREAINKHVAGADLKGPGKSPESLRDVIRAKDEHIKDLNQALRYALTKPRPGQW